MRAFAKPLLLFLKFSFDIYNNVYSTFLKVWNTFVWYETNNQVARREFSCFWTWMLHTRLLRTETRFTWRIRWKTRKRRDVGVSPNESIEHRASRSEAPLGYHERWRLGSFISVREEAGTRSSRFFSDTAILTSAAPPAYSWSPLPPRVLERFHLRGLSVLLLLLFHQARRPPTSYRHLRPLN